MIFTDHGGQPQFFAGTVLYQGPGFGYAELGDTESYVDTGKLGAHTTVDDGETIFRSLLRQQFIYGRLEFRCRDDLRLFRVAELLRIRRQMLVAAGDLEPAGTPAAAQIKGLTFSLLHGSDLRHNRCGESRLLDKPLDIRLLACLNFNCLCHVTPHFPLPERAVHAFPGRLPSPHWSE